jgi:large subunit ribosomal protein L21
MFIGHDMEKSKKNNMTPDFDKYAIFQTGGKQYQAIEGKTVAIEKIEGENGASLEFDEVLFRKNGEGSFEVGKPFLQKSIKASIVKQMKGPKLTIFKFGRRKKIRVKKGHRQSMTVIRIESV